MFITFVFLFNFFNVFGSYLPDIAIEKITIEKNANIFINSIRTKGIEFTTNIVPQKKTAVPGGYDIRQTDMYEYTKPQKTLYVGDNLSKIVLVKDLGGVSYLIYASSDKEKESNTFCDENFIKKVYSSDLPPFSDCGRSDNKTFFMQRTGIDFLIKYGKQGKFSITCNRSKLRLKPKNRKQIEYFDYNVSETKLPARKAPSEAHNLFIKHRDNTVQVDYATNQHYTTAFQKAIFDMELSRERPVYVPFEYVPSKIVVMAGGILIIVFAVTLRKFFFVKNNNQK